MTTFRTTVIYTTQDIVSVATGLRWIKVTAPSGRSITVEWNDTVDYSENHADAAAQLFSLITGCPSDDITLAGSAIYWPGSGMAWSVLPREAPAAS